MSFTGVSSLDHSIAKVNVWLAETADEFGTSDRHFAYRVTRAWLHALRDRLPAPIAAHFAAQLPELLRGVFYDGWNPSKVPVKYGRDGYVTRFARDSSIAEMDVPRAASLVTRIVRRHVTGGVLDEALDVLPAEVRLLAEPTDVELLTRSGR
jgi:uncharacterized protein (DUF2267 family)